MNLLNPTNDEKSRAVAEKLGLWKTGHHYTPPPDLITPEGADMLMTALLKAGYILDQWQGSTRVYYTIRDTTQQYHGVYYRPEHRVAVHPDWKRAQLDAAYKLLVENPT